MRVGTIVPFEALDRSGWTRVLLAWAALAVLMSANGIFRELVLRRVAGTPGSDIASALLGVAIVLLTTRWLFPPLRDRSTGALLLVGAALLVMTVAFETALGRWIDHKSWAEIGAHYALQNGELWPIVLAVVGLTPLVWGRWLPQD